MTLRYAHLSKESMEEAVKTLDILREKIAETTLDAQGGQGW